ncbi:MAG: FAD-dependent monooxygenase [Azospirillaceae bacterium]
MRILIVGAGIAGLSLAIGLCRQGIVPTVIEQRRRWGDLGSGIQMQGNAVRALDRLGVAEALLARSWASPHDRMLITDQSGAVLTQVTYPPIAGPHRPGATGMRRQVLHEVLLAALEAAGGAVRLGTTVTDLEPGAADGAPARYRLEGDGAAVGDADLVIAAEGIGSPLRQRFLGAGRRPTGLAVWRADLPRPAGLDDKVMMLGPGLRFGIIPTDAERLYFFATSPEPPGARLDPGRLDALVKARFDGFGGWAAMLLARVERPSQVVFTQAEEVFQEPPWHSGRLVLIGDAAHASTPFLSLGGGLGVEDAVVLAEEVAGVAAGSQALTAALERYTERRVARCRLVQEASRAAGEAGATSDPAAFDAMLATLPTTAQANIDRVYERLAEPL